ncbi:MAG: hypothetical protein ISR78_09600 [Spirochaetia bacterium]|nr:hypothetical protein [Spirochaetia bacterium]
MNFQKGAKQHLSDYKKGMLNISENGSYFNNGKYYSHILPITESVKKEFINYFQNFDRHGKLYLV